VDAFFYAVDCFFFGPPPNQANSRNVCCGILNGAVSALKLMVYSKTFFSWTDFRLRGGFQLGRFDLNLFFAAGIACSLYTSPARFSFFEANIFAGCRPKFSRRVFFLVFLFLFLSLWPQ